MCVCVCVCVCVCGVCVCVCVCVWGGGAVSQKTFFRPLGAQFGLKIRGTLHWIRYCLVPVPKVSVLEKVNSKKNQQGRKLTATSVMQDSDYS